MSEMYRTISRRVRKCRMAAAEVMAQMDVAWWQVQN